MPIIAIYRSKDIDREAFAKYRAMVPIEPAPPEAVAHFYGRGAAGELCVVDIWEDRAAMERFGRDEIKPALDSLGLPFPPPEIYEVETAALIGDLESYRIAKREAEPA